MESDGKRRLKDGREFDHLFTPPDGKDYVVKKGANLADTMNLIRKALPRVVWQSERIAKLLKGRTLEETCSNVWHFVYDHIQYKPDEEGVEQVRSPRRTWSDRSVGVDCDCYSVLILSVLMSLRIPCIARITKYPKVYPDVPRWQHIYPIVPKPGYWNSYAEARDRYIVIDCVKDDFDDEQRFLECKDYDMRLDFLDGIEETSAVKEEEAEDLYASYVEFDNVDVEDIAAVHGYDDLGFLKKLVKKVSSAVKKVGDKVGQAVKTTVKKTGAVVKKVGDKIGDGLRIVNRFLNPATILLRNGFLLAMKINLLNVAGRLRYAYVSDSQAEVMGMNPDGLRKVRTVKDRAETVYWQAGGKKENLKKAILNGRGNKDKKVQLSGLFGLDDEYMDMDEYRIIHSDPDNLDGLGEIASGAAIAAATSAVAAIASALSQVKGLFTKGGSAEQSFQSETDNAGDSSSAPPVVSDSEDVLRDENEIETPATNYSQPFLPALPTSTATRSSVDLPARTPTQVLTTPAEARRSSETPMQTAAPPSKVPEQTQGFMQKTSTWVKTNPGKSLLIAGALVGGGFMAAKVLTKKPKTGSGLSGLPGGKKKRKKRKGKKQRVRKEKIQTIKL